MICFGWGGQAAPSRRSEGMPETGGLLRPKPGRSVEAVKTEEAVVLKPQAQLQVGCLDISATGEP